MNNPTIKQLLERRSIRVFTDEEVKDADLQTILRAAQQAPTSINAEQVSLVVTRDRDTIQKIAQIAGGQPQVAAAPIFVTFVIDFNRTYQACRLVGEEQVIERSAEGLVSGAVDVGIMLSSFQTAAEALGYGTTCIGGIRANPKAMIELLKLPPRTYPLVGSTLGVPDLAKRPQVKPRVPLESFAFDETYSQEKMLAGVLTYDTTLRNWRDAQGMTSMPSYAQSTAGAYKQVYFPKVAETLSAQGFGFLDES